MILAAGFAAYFLRLSGYVQSYRPAIFNLPPKTYFEIMLMVAPAWILIFAMLGLYKMRRRSALEEFLQIISASSLAFMILVLYIFLSHEWFESRFIILIGWIFAIMSVWLGRLLARIFKNYFVARRSFFAERTLIIGDNFLVHSLIKEISQKPSLGYRIIRHMQEPDFEEIKRMIDQNEVSYIVASTDNLKNGSFTELMYLCADKNINFKFIPSEFQSQSMHFEVETLKGIPLLAARKTALRGWGRVGKRSVDIIGSLLGLIILSPVFLLLAIIIKLDSEGPVFAKLKRISAGKPFDLYKFRSMIKNAHDMKKDLMQYNERQDGPLFKMKNDPRITKVGRFIRKWRIDELPQLFNVLIGDMSLVGPRPHEPEEIAHYKPHQKKLLSLKAGITGLAQISGSSDLPFEEEVKLDVFYIENWSFLLDLKILLKTVVVVFTDKSAC
jgi:exopolysaccharide biosynthesis polyprenyl glycosylphosphotransferase